LLPFCQTTAYYYSIGQSLFVRQPLTYPLLPCMVLTAIHTFQEQLSTPKLLLMDWFIWWILSFARQIATRWRQEAKHDSVVLLLSLLGSIAGASGVHMSATTCLYQKARKWSG
jgi:hypothetical protein